MAAATFFTSSPKIADMFQIFGPYVSARKGSYLCPTQTDPIDLAAEIRNRLSGGPAIIGIGGNESDIVSGAKTLEVASRTNLCAIVVEQEAFEPFVIWFTGLRKVDAHFIASRVAAAVLVGKGGFEGFGTYFDKANVYRIGGFGWSATTCEKIAAHIKEATIRK